MAKDKKISSSKKDENPIPTPVKQASSLTGTVQSAPPVVTLLGHVDHGKTTLLDAIRKTSVAEKEHGGITQKIGAYQIETLHEGKKLKITFIDTPGHEAFASMRARGGKVADVGLLIVSSTEGIRPQTKESIEILKTSGIPFITVLTKSDLPEKNVEKVKGQIAAGGIEFEEYGGDVPVIEVSAKTGQNIKELLDLILLVWELQGEKPQDNQLNAVVIESRLDKNSGPRATVVVKSGKIVEREEIFADGIKCKVRSIVNDRGQRLKEAVSGDAVEILGFEKVPAVGGIVTKISNIKEQISNTEVANSAPRASGIGPAPIAAPYFLNNQEEENKRLSIVISADTLGSLEAITAALPAELNVAQKKTGEITSQDILFAKSISAIVIGFNVKILPEAQKLASTEKILIRNYQLIYELIEELTDAAEGKRLSFEEEVYGKAKIKANFPFEKTQVAGVEILEGRLAKGDKVRVVRGEELVGESIISSLRQGKEQTSKVEEGKEAGVILSPSVDFNIGDMLISHS